MILLMINIVSRQRVQQGYSLTEPKLQAGLAALGFLRDVLKHCCLHSVPDGYYAFTITCTSLAAGLSLLSFQIIHRILTSGELVLNSFRSLTSFAYLHEWNEELCLPL